MKPTSLIVGVLIFGALGVSIASASDEIDPNDGPPSTSPQAAPPQVVPPVSTAAPLAESSAGQTLKAQFEQASPQNAAADSHNEGPAPSISEQLLEPSEHQADQALVTPSVGTVPEAVDEPSVEEQETAESSNDSVKPLALLDAEVLPGTARRSGWRPSNSFNSITAPTNVLVVNGVKPGPTLCLTAAIHGDELNGIEIVRQVLFDIDPKSLSGAVIGVPIVNLDGFRRASRYLTDRRDLNRFFPGNPQGSSASRLAHSFFTQIVQHCTLLIDLHTGSFRRTNLPQLRADLTYTQVTELADKMGSILVVQSKGAVGSLRRAAVEAGIPAVTLEAGAAHEFSRSAVEAGVKSVESALDGLKMLKLRRFWERKPQPIYFDSLWVRAAASGILFSNVELGQHVEKGDALGTITDPITNVKTVVAAPIDGHVIGKALNQIMFPGFAAYHLGYAAEPHPEIDLSAFKQADAVAATQDLTPEDSPVLYQSPDHADDAVEGIDLGADLATEGEADAAVLETLPPDEGIDE